MCLDFVWPYIIQNLYRIYEGSVFLFINRLEVIKCLRPYITWEE